MLNVAELLYARNDLDVGAGGYSILVALTGAGIVIGSLLGARPSSIATQRRRYLAGVGLLGVALLGLSVAPAFAVACPLMVLAGVGNGLVLVYGRVLIQRIVPASLLGRVFGIKDAVLSTALGVAFLTAGVLVSLIGTRELIAVAGGGALVVWLLASLRLRRSWPVGAPGTVAAEA
jgi:MFS family permease